MRQVCLPFEDAKEKNVCLGQLGFVGHRVAWHRRVQGDSLYIYIYIQNGMLKLGLDTITICDKKKKGEGC